VGRKCISKEMRELIFGMVAENATWGAPRIHGELKMLGFDISERTVLRWMRKAPRSPESTKRWPTFLRNHREVIAAMDFFTVPTLTHPAACGALQSRGFYPIAAGRTCSSRQNLKFQALVSARRLGQFYTLCPRLLEMPGICPSQLGRVHVWEILQS
jgi:hypothetical protein